VQTIGTVLQLTGSVITLVGLVLARNVLTRALNQWSEAVGGQLSRLRDSLASLGKRTPTGTASAQYGWTITAIGATPTTGTAEERITQLEGRLVKQRVTLTKELLAAIDKAIAAEREERKVVQLREISVAAGGIAVSIVGYLCQLIG
jgi:hypothetical protein